MKKTWVLIANGERARFFERHAQDHALIELADFTYPYLSLGGTASGGDLTGAAGKGHGRSGHAGTQFEPHTDAKDKAQASFARQLADYLNEGAATQRYQALVLIASSQILGEIKPCLDPLAQKALERTVPSDLTKFTGPKLKERVDLALQLPT